MYHHGGEALEEYNIKYDFSVNTNPLGAPKQVYRSLTTLDELEQYPKKADYDRLCEMIIRHESDCYGIRPDCDEEKVILGNGASEIIFSLIMMLRPHLALIEEPCFFGYERAARAAGADIIYAGIDEMNELIREKKPDIVCICNPQSPTGKLKDESRLKQIAASCDDVGAHLFLDECFLEFVPDYGKRTFAPFLNKYKYLTLIRAFTKVYSIPGVRLGYAYVSSALQEFEPRNYFSEWNVSSIALRFGMEAMSAGSGYIRETQKLIEKEKSYLASCLESLGMTEISGDVNYLFFKCEKKLYRPLLERGFLIRRCNNYHGIPKSGYYRIAVKTRPQNEVLIASVENILESEE